MISISTHVLDIAAGEPAAGVAVALDRWDGGWSRIGHGSTDDDGRIARLGEGLAPGRYRLAFDTASYGNEFYPEVVIDVYLGDEDEHFHVPLLLSPFGYSTYRGS